MTKSTLDHPVAPSRMAVSSESASGVGCRRYPPGTLVDPLPSADASLPDDDDALWPTLGDTPADKRFHMP